MELTAWILAVAGSSLLAYVAGYVRGARAIAKSVVTATDAIKEFEKRGLHSLADETEARFNKLIEVTLK